jgi:hypothetical protein
VKTCYLRPATNNEAFQYMNDFTLLPHPQSITYTGQIFSLPATGLIALHGDDVPAMLFTAVWLQDALFEQAGADYELVGGAGVPPEQIVVQLSLIPGSVRHEQGYELTVVDGRVDAIANTIPGLFYAVQTLCQLLEQVGNELPTLRCRDWPDFPQRGVMLDISRNKVPTLETVLDLVDMLAGWKINQLQLYTEHTFAYRRHPIVWQEASPFTAEEILTLDAYCHDRCIELVPNQNTFGHMHHWLKHPAYQHLAEKADGAQTPWGYYNPEPFSLSPAVPGSLDLVRDLLDELLPNFRSRQVNVGGDETYDVGQGMSKELVAEKGKGRVYLEHLLKIYREVQARGRTMQFWGDIIMEYPELTHELPRDLIALEWGYEAGHPFGEHGRLFAESGVPFYVCPGTSGWNTLGGRTNNAIGNLQNAAQHGRTHGAVGYLITDWGDNGHMQPLPVSYLGFAVGAALAWADEANRGLDVPTALSRFAFRDEAGIMGQLAYDLGNVYEITRIPSFNGTPYFYGLVYDLAQMVNADDPVEMRVRMQNLAQAVTAVDELLACLPQTDMQRDDADLIRQEFIWAATMIKHGCRRLIWAAGRALGQEDAALRQALAAETGYLLAEFEQVWHGRNRPGGFPASLARLQKMAADYDKK